MNVKEQIQNLANTYAEEFVAIRRKLHAHPELSFHEHQTAAFVSQQLTEMGIEHKTGIAQTGLLAVIKGEKGTGKTIALRADMDALPIEEENNFPFKSQNPGVMHACGHDLHTSCLLGTAKILNQLKSNFSGTVLLVFQPAEEKLPGGAKLMMEDGLFDEYIPEVIIGQHVYPELPAGEVGFKPGQYMASADELYITLKGKGGHAALPHNTVDTVLMASQTVVSLQQVVSRFIPTQVPAVLSIGNIVCKSAMNIIPETVRLEGTFRTMDEDWRYKAHEKIRQITESVAQGMGGTCEVDIQVGFPSVYNNPELTLAMQSEARQLLGEEKVHDLDIRMTAEDFGWYAQKYPACFYRLGVGHTDGTVSGGLHTPNFNPNEKAIETGMQLMSFLAIKALEI
ncbi:MAG: M20 family metallopeptidase [Salinivirgaceae bacterium]